MYYDSGKCCEITSVIVSFTFTVLIFSCQFRTLNHEAGSFCALSVKSVLVIIGYYYKYYDTLSLKILRKYYKYIKFISF